MELSEKRLKFTKIAVGLALVILVILIAISGFRYWQKTELRVEVPESLAKKADQYVISKVGENFFDKYFMVDLSSNYAHIGEKLQSYYIHYSFNIPEKNDVSGSVSLMINNSGNITVQYGGIPDCLRGCNFLKRDQAMEIAKEAGFALDKGEGANFHWDDEQKVYVWAVKHRTGSTEDSIGTNYVGKQMNIDANSGKIYGISDWKNFEIKACGSSGGSC
jgi:hypothetical protein